MKRFIPGVLAALVSLGGTSVAAAGEEPLPEPLTLEAATKRAEAGHPALRQARARLDRARAGLMSAESIGALNVYLDGRARWVEPPPLTEELGRDDHKGSLVVERNLYDFGRSSALEKAATADVRASNWRYQRAVTQQRIRIMEAYFNVLLADLQFARDNEEMAIVFVNLDKLRDRHELGQVSDIQLLELESEYQRVRRKRAESQNRQRTTRARLAHLLNTPDRLPSELVRPDLPQLGRAPPTFEDVWARVREGNQVLKALRADVEAARKRVAAARATGRPRLNGEVTASAYSRELGSSDTWRAGVNIEVPLYTGGAVDAAVAGETADLYRLQALMRETEYELRQQVLELVMDLQTFDLKEEESWAQLDYRELYLDRSRAIYEMEVKTDLGDAMVRLTEADLKAARTKYEAVLAWERLDALAGGNITANNQKDGEAR